jgi:hypothetical protein
MRVVVNKLENNSEDTDVMLMWILPNCQRDEVPTARGTVGKDN